MFIWAPHCCFVQRNIILEDVFIVLDSITVSAVGGMSCEGCDKNCQSHIFIVCQLLVSEIK